VLADTSIWIDQIRGGHARLTALLEEDLVIGHPFVAGELAMGNLRGPAILQTFDRLPQAEVATNGEVRMAIARYGLGGTGMNYVDAHLLVSTILTLDCLLLTRDKALLAAAERLGVAA